MDVFDEIDRVEQICLARAGRAASHIHTGNSPLATNDYRAPGEGGFILGMTHFNPTHIGDGIGAFHGCGISFGSKGFVPVT
jgi:hypothetical protein